MTPEEERAIRETLETNRGAIEAAGSELEGYARQVCARLERESNMRPRLVEVRAKPVTSVVRRMKAEAASPDSLFQVVGDLIGVRVVVYNLSDVPVFRNEVLEDDGSPIENMESENIDYRTGYRAVHINGWIGGYGAEIQIRTAVQDAWAVTSRADVYRAGESPLVQSLSAAQATVLHGVDEVLQEIRTLSEKSRGDGTSVEEISASDEESQVKLAVEGLNDGRLKEALENLSSEERFVLYGAISAERVEELKAGIESERESSGVRQIFRAAGSYKRVREYRADARFGNRMMVWKGPLVERSNWGLFQPTDYARGLEGFLLNQLARQLGDRLANGRVIATWDELADFIRAGEKALEDQGGVADLVVIQGRIEEDLDIELLKNGDWRQPPVIRGVSLGQESPIRELVEGIPLMRIFGEAPVPSVHIVDLSGITYTQTNPSAMSDEELSLRIDDLEPDSAAEIFDANEDLASSLYRTQHNEEGLLNREEGVVYLQLQVKLSLVEGGLIEDAGDAEPNLSAHLEERD